MIIKPNQVNYSDLVKFESLSPINYRRMMINNEKCAKLKDLLDSNEPFIKGNEPGSINYVENSNLGFIRNSCISSDSYRIDDKKIIFLNPLRCESLELSEGDILLAKDANIGDCAIVDSYLLNQTNIGSFRFSSGLVKLNIRRDSIDPFYLFGIISSSFFRNQMRILSGKGMTITHAKDLFLECLIPIPKNDLVTSLITAGCKIILKKEMLTRLKWEKIMDIIHNEISRHKDDFYHSYPRYSDLFQKLRFDASFFSPEYNLYIHELDSSPNGKKSVEELGHTTKRGPNLAVRDSGRMTFTKNRINQAFWIVIRPKDLSDFGTIVDYEFLGNRQPKWSFQKGDILFGAEGTIGKIFIFCDEIKNITTNFHGIMISHDNLIDSITLGSLLGYLRERGILDKISVGGQGGSLSLTHWNYLFIPLLSKNIKEKIGKYYFSLPSQPVPNTSLDDIINHYLKYINEFGIFQYDYHIRFLKNLINKIVDLLALDKRIDENILIERFVNLSFQNSFDNPF